MLSEFPAPEIHFRGLGASGSTAAEAAERLASLLRQWTASHPACRVLQLSILPAVPGQPAVGRDDAIGAMAVIAYTESGITTADVAEAVAAAVEEIHEAQAAPDGPTEPVG